MRILVASSNPHKIDEIRSVFDELRGAPSTHSSGVQIHVDVSRVPGFARHGSIHAAMPIELVSLKDIGLHISEPEEDQETFEENAALKARYYADAAGMLCLADDSGLEVDALDGEPGIRSARYAGVTGPRSVVDPANNELLLERLRGVPSFERTARFVCAMALVTPAQPGELAIVRGEVQGQILTEDEGPRGTNGFGYDPLFFIPERGKTTAELSPGEKNAISHRGRAARLMWDEIRRLMD